MDILEFILKCYLLAGLTWIYYLAAMHLEENRHKLSIGAKIFGYPIIAGGILIYIILNIVVGSILFLEPPKTLRFTKRCQRHIAKRDGSWRYHLALWFCANLLDPFDEGGHC